MAVCHIVLALDLIVLTLGSYNSMTEHLASTDANPSAETTSPEIKRPLHFLQQIIRKDLEQGAHTSIATRFPPEPNGYLHLGHASSICLNFGLGLKYNAPVSIEAEALLNEAAALFKKHNVDNLLVTHNGRPVGVLDIQDIQQREHYL